MIKPTFLYTFNVNLFDTLCLSTFLVGQGNIPSNIVPMINVLTNFLYLFNVNLFGALCLATLFEKKQFNLLSYRVKDGIKVITIMNYINIFEVTTHVGRPAS